MIAQASSATKALRMFLKRMASDQIIQLLKRAIAKREFLRKTTNAMRLVNSKGDGLEGLILEQYNQHFLAQVFDPRWLNQSEFLRDFLKQNFKVDYFIIKDRSKSAGSNPEAIATDVLIENKNSVTVVKENNLLFEVNLNDGLNTGLFLDMRTNRLSVGQKCRNQRVLNCFSYTCSFGVYAKAHGAKEVVNLDISKKILQKGARNYALNALPVTEGEFLKADVQQYLERAVKKDNQFDIIIIDPPSFSRAEGKVFNIEKTLPTLLTNALKVLKAGGMLFLSSNYSVLSASKLLEIFKKCNQGRITKKILSLGQDKDFLGSGTMKESYLVALLVEY